MNDDILPQRFWSKVARRDGGCWEWIAAKSHDGYGKFKVGGRVRYSHRVAYEAIVGLVAESAQLDHLCRNRACVNPDHLEPVTHRENARRGERAMRTHCRHGHPYSSANVYRDPSGRRSCRACNRAAVRRYEQRTKVAIAR